MPNFKKKVFIITVIAVIFALGIYFTVKAVTSPYSFGKTGVLDTALNSDGSILYVSYFKDNAIVEIDTNTMLEIHRFNILRPNFITLSIDDLYLYVLSRSYPDQLARIQLSNGSISSITLEGYANNFCIYPGNQKIWIVSAVWPGNMEPVDNQDVPNHPRTGRLTEVDLSDFSISGVIAIDPIPISVWYSVYSDKLYVLHDEEVRYNNGDYHNWDDWVIGKRIFVYDASTLEEIGDFTGGGVNTFLNYPPPQLTGWDDEGRYLAIPNTGGSAPEYSFRIIDTVDDSVAFDLSIMGDDYASSFIFAHKQPDSDNFWAAIYRGRPDSLCPDGTASLVCINTVTHEHETYCIEDMEWDFGDFTFSPDGDTFYIPEIETGNLFVWSPD